MTNSQPHSYKPSHKQLRYLRVLAEGCGETFVAPETKADASREIERLKGRRRLTSLERRRQDLQLAAEDHTPRGDAASVRPDELSGYGSTAAWSTGVEG